MAFFTLYPWDEVLGSRWGGAPRSGARGPGAVAGIRVVNVAGVCSPLVRCDLNIQSVRDRDINPRGGYAY